MRQKGTIVSAAPLAMMLASMLAVAPKIRSAPPYAQDSDSKPKQAQGAIPVPLPKGKKLVLTDGTFQLAREYSVQGDRVRYWSIERSDWEEIPVSLVDWDATHKAEADQAREAADLKARMRATDLIERTKDIDVDRSLEIKPGIFLPDTNGFFSLDDKILYEMKQSVAVAKRSTGREVEKIMTGVPLIPSKQTLEIPDEHAPLRLTSREPEFFMRPVDGRTPRFKLLHAQIKGGHRVLDNVSIHFTGEETHKTNDVDFQTWTPASGVFRYTVGKPLEPGEYAFVEITSEGINGYVWDFGIDPAGKNLKK